MDAEDVIKIAVDRYELAKTATSEDYEKSREDLYFISDEPNSQWDPKLLADRKNRPVYQIDQLSQFIHQVENDERMNTPSITIIPDDEATDVETAEILQGLIRGIEYKSNADAAYDNAGSFAIRCGLGWIRVDHDYVKDDSFEQELLIKRVINPLSIFLDPDSVESDGSDAKWAIALEEMSVKRFEETYPDAEVMSFGDSKTAKELKKETITIAEYFFIEEEEQEFGLTETGEIQKKDKNGVYKTVRKVKKRKVMRYKLSGSAVLEKTTFPGKYIPLVPVYGEEAWRDGKHHFLSLIRKAKEAQQMFNLGISLDIEMLMKQPQASFQAAAGTISGFEHEYADPAKANVLHYNQTDVNGKDAPPPQRVQAPTGSVGFIQMSANAVDNIKSTLGMYNAALGQRSNETSGKAINARKIEADVAVFHFSDNLMRSITQVGKIIVCAKDEVYDTPRFVKIVDKEDNAKIVGINGARTKKQEKTYNIKNGSYDVRVIAGPSFTTQRQEAAANYSQIVQAMPDLMPVIGDLVFKYQDTAGSQAISERLKKVIKKTNPDLLSEEEMGDNEVDPQVAALQAQMQALQQETQATIAQLQAELQSKAAEVQGKQVDAQIKVKELEIKQGDQQLKAQELQTKAALEAEKLAIERQKVEIEAYNAQKEVMPIQQQSTQPVGIKLDTTGFQMMKTPEQEAREEEESQREMMEAQAKQAQSEAVIQAVVGIQQLLGALVEQTAVQTQTIAQQTQVMSKPIEVMRDENGNITGAV